MTEQIETKVKNHVLHVILNRPEKKNALTRAMYRGISEALANAENDPDIRVVLFYGNGDGFCAGNDLRDFQNTEPRTEGRSSGNVSELVMRAQKPLIAAVHGFSIGVGVTMLFHFDLIYAAENTRLRLPFTNLGLVPEFGSTYMLPAIIGHTRAAELFLFGDFFTAEKAREYGIVNQIFKKEELIPKVIRLAEQLAEKPPTAMRSTKILMKKYSIENLKKFMSEEGMEFFRRQKSPEAQEAFAAFFERRKPDFSKFD